MIIRETHRANVPVVTLTEHDLESLAHEALGLESARLGHAINVFDQPARPLSRIYKKAKVKAGGQPIRDLHLTGAMLGSRGIVAEQEKSVNVGFTDSLEFAKAAHNETFEHMLGVSPGDELQVDDLARDLLERNIRELNGQ
jgi:hypothetical protein